MQEKERQRDAASGRIGTTKALEILEIEAGATELEIRAAYKRLTKRVNPDVGLSEYFSKQLNAAREDRVRLSNPHDHDHCIPRRTVSCRGYGRWRSLFSQQTGDEARSGELHPVCAALHTTLQESSDE